MRFAIALGMSLGFCHGWIVTDQRQLAVSGWSSAGGFATFVNPSSGSGVLLSP